MQAYTYDQDGDSFVFTIFKPRHQGLVQALFPFALIGAIFTFGITLIAWLIWAVMRLVKNKAGSEITYTSKVVGRLRVSRNRIVPFKGKELSTSRLKTIGIRNGYEKGFQVETGRSSSGGWLVGGAAGAGMAVADGMASISASHRSSIMSQRAKTAFYLTAEAGGIEYKLTTPDLSEPAARALQDDVIRVLEGQAM